MLHQEPTHAVTDVLDSLAEAGGDGTVSVGQIVERMGGRSFAPLLLVPALLMVSPLSSIPGTPTLSAAIIGTIALQMLFGRPSIWLPRFLAARRFRRDRLDRAIGFLRRPVAFVERHMRPRLRLLTDPPGATVAVLVCLGITFVMPVMEFLPLLASVAATAIALIAAGLLARDGVLVLAGYGVVAAGIVIASALVRGAQQI